MALLMLASAAPGEAPSAQPYEKDVSFLASKVAQYRYQLKGSPEGAKLLSAMETGVAEMKSVVAQLKEEAEAVGDKDRKLMYLKTMELGPKERALEQLRRSYAAWQAEISQDKGALKQAWSVYSSGQLHFITPQEHAAYNAKWAEWHLLNDRDAALQRRSKEGNRDFHEQVDTAVKAYTKVQQEFSQTESKREQAAQRFKSRAEEYANTRSAVVPELEALDNEPARATSGTMTPFPAESVPSERAGTVGITRPPIGPGNNTHALDQLRVVTASSRDAAGVDEQGRVVHPPQEPVAARESGYGFDTGQGTGMADLPEVDTPASRPAEAVPLVLPAPPENAPLAVMNSPTLQKFSQAQTDGFSKLDQLYQQRRDIMQQGAKASPEAWTQVVKEISETQAKVNMAGVGLKLAEGSQLIDLTIVPKAQRKVSDLTVPPPPPPASAKP